VAAALLVALLPMFRTVALALAVALAVPWLAAGRTRALARASIAGALVAVAGAPIVARVAETHTFQDRVTDPSSVFSRVATLNAGAGIVADHPLAGVGLANYGAAFDAKYGTAWYVSVDEVSGVGAERSPHNNLLGVWVELGLAGIVFYLLAAITVAGAAWRRRNTFALALLAVYAVPGATLYHGVYSECNLALFCALAVALRAGEDAP
jgi:O-antigen ligase